MSIIQDITEKYYGKYSAESEKSFNSPVGKHSFQQKKGIIEIDGTKISINLNAVKGATYGTEPFRITLHLNKTYTIKFSAFPKSLWHRFLDFLIPSRVVLIPKSVRNQFLFGGDKDIIKNIVSDEIFIKNIANEKLYIGTMAKPTNKIILTPAHGIKDMKQFEKFISILKCVQKTIEENAP
ncbi:hypothetical protein [uncultured Psychroserpens sp.]|uniref:hypothetical protein n=1 Tax=uncultured Psychroserpens sp. TaxID=255436 RepID=UPI0026078CBF|nr:hypothetical protein [uncultured Psychroserpens sp.]